jgi:rhamnose transport system ATP-binding protein
MTAPLLQLKSVTKSFGAVRALKGVSFDLAAGEVHALLGENGAGKSTLIKIVTGAHPPDGGTMEIDGRAIERLTPAAARACGIAAIYQQPALFPDLSIAENIALGLEPPALARRVHQRQRHQRASELLKRVGARIDPDKEVRDLSMPEQQLVEIARALGAGARILIMDEPTASLTAREVDILLTLVRNLRASGVGIIYISHRLEEVFEVADRVTVLRDGETVGTRQLRRTPVPILTPEAGTKITASVAEPSAPTLSKAELIHMMVGREVSTIFPAAENTPGAPLLLLDRVGCQSTGIREISFEVRRGEILGLAGLVGAGRTELARILFGLTPADSGISAHSLRTDSGRLRADPARRQTTADPLACRSCRRRYKLCAGGSKAPWGNSGNDGRRQRNDGHSSQAFPVQLASARG